MSGKLAAHINFNFLSTFLLVAENQSFRRAADLAFRSQSAVSMQIRQLEDQLGVTLFHRTTRKVELTEEGKHLLAYTQRALDELNLGLEEVKNSADLQRGRINFGCVPTIGSTALPKIINRFGRDHPAVTVSVQDLTGTALLDAIRTTTLEFGIGPKISHASDFQFEVFANDTLYAVAPDRYTKANQTKMRLEDLAKAPLLTFAANTALRATLDTAFAERGIAPHSQYEFQHVQTQVAMAAEGLGVTVLPHVALPLAKPYPLRILPIVEPVINRELAVITYRGRALSPLARKFVRILTENLGNIEPAPTGS